MKDIWKMYEFSGNFPHYACTGNARKALEEIGEGSIWWVEVPIDNEETIGHAFVVTSLHRLVDFPLNRYRGKIAGLGNLKVGDIMAQGKDITKQINETPWSML